MKTILGQHQYIQKLSCFNGFIFSWLLTIQIGITTVLPQFVLGVALVPAQVLLLDVGYGQAQRDGLMALIVGVEFVLAGDSEVPAVLLPHTDPDRGRGAATL